MMRIGCVGNAMSGCRDAIVSGVFGLSSLLVLLPPPLPLLCGWLVFGATVFGVTEAGGPLFDLIGMNEITANEIGARIQTRLKCN